MTEPRFMARYSAGRVGSADDGRLFSPSFERNFEPIRDGLRPHLDGATGIVLEIGCGTGQHGAHLAQAFPGLTWLPSDIDATHHASTAAWIAHLGVTNAEAPIHLDAAADWPGGPALAAHLPLAGVFASNVIHIAPWAVAQGTVAGAGRALAPGGVLIFYGPFKEGGVHTGEGNMRFDASLQAQDPAWGVRDLDRIAALAKAAGLGPAEVTEMPSNNRLVAFAKV